MGDPVYLPHRTGMFLHEQHGKGWSVLRRLLRLLLHQAARQLRHALPIDQMGGPARGERREQVSCGSRDLIIKRKLNRCKKKINALMSGQPSKKRPSASGHVQFCSVLLHLRSDPYRVRLDQADHLFSHLQFQFRYPLYRQLHRYADSHVHLDQRRPSRRRNLEMAGTEARICNLTPVIFFCISPSE